MAETRKLAAILAADVVGYSRLAGADEDRTLARLRGAAERSDRSRHRRASRPRSEADGRRRPHRVQKRRGCRALRHRGAERYGRAQRRASARAPHRVPHRHPSGRCGRGERRRPDGRRRQYRRAIGRYRQARGDLSFRGRLSAGEVDGSISPSAIWAQPNSRTSPSRSGSIRSKSARRHRRSRPSPPHQSSVQYSCCWARGSSHSS